MEDELLTLDQVAEILKVAKRTLYRYMEDEDYPLPTININPDATRPTLRVRKSELELWLKAIPDPRQDV
jgi:predicted DNA-binding transcriptional regulator AlpA